MIGRRLNKITQRLLRDLVERNAVASQRSYTNEKFLGRKNFVDLQAASDKRTQPGC
jgi:hypothetical protein